MATLPIEQVTQRERKHMVTMQADPNWDGTGETLWAGTTDPGPRTITMDKTVAADQKDRAAIDTRIAAASKTKRGY